MRKNTCIIFITFVIVALDVPQVSKLDYCDACLISYQPYTQFQHLHSQHYHRIQTGDTTDIKERNQNRSFWVIFINFGWYFAIEELR